MRGSCVRAALMLAALSMTPRPAWAQGRPSAAVLATAATGADAELARSYDRVLRARLDALEVVSARGSVALNLADVQLALGCEGESEGCLRAVANELGVQLLLIPNLDRIGSGLVFSVALFDTSSDGPARRVERTASGDDAAEQLASQVDGLLREVFGLSGPADVAGDPGEATDELASPPSDEVVPDPAAMQGEHRAAEPDPGRLGAAIAVAVLGLGGLGLGVGFGVASVDAENAYAEAPSATEEDAAEALAQLRTATDLATAANALFVAGGVVAAAGVAWIIVEAVLPSSVDLEETAVLPLFLEGGGGLSLTSVLR